MENFRLPNIQITPIHIQESERFQQAFRSVKDALDAIVKEDEELALFYVNGRETIRVYRVQISQDTLVLLSGLDESGNAAYVVTSVKDAALIFKKLKLAKEKKRTPIGFSNTVTPEGLSSNLPSST